VLAFLTFGVASVAADVPAPTCEGTPATIVGTAGRSSGRTGRTWSSGRPARTRSTATAATIWFAARLTGRLSTAATPSTAAPATIRSSACSAKIGSMPATATTASRRQLHGRAGQPRFEAEW